MSKTRMMLRAKIHGAVVTKTRLDYGGSLTLDEALIEEADMIPYEQVHVDNISNGERFVTYLIKGQKGSGVVCVNGAAVHKASVGDKLIIAAYGMMEEAAASQFFPKILILDEKNRIRTAK